MYLIIFDRFCLFHNIIKLNTYIYIYIYVYVFNLVYLLRTTVHTVGQRYTSGYMPRLVVPLIFLLFFVFLRPITKARPSQRVYLSSLPRLFSFSPF